MNSKRAALPNRIDIAAIQLASLPLDSAKLDYHISMAKERGCRLIVLGEYVCNLFFKELEKMPLSFVAEQGKRQFESLKTLARQYSVNLIAPLVTVHAGRPTKSLFCFAPHKTTRYDQRILMDYPHWNEARFFTGNTGQHKSPLVFSHQGFKVGALFGFELHFDSLWLELTRRKVDVVLIPSAATFESFARWQTLLKARAFLGGCYTVRANRVGYYEGGEHRWNFYGNSLYVNPFGEIENALGDREEILIVSLDKNELKEARRAFGFGRLQGRIR